ncbi:ANTAR domain-containing protein [Streptomyces sp. NPDC020681]|uniref:GAF and ANTAR domain-containing protein n=1 Tax=Streptomyces sp. NPDC020681 TaxID=3365083 RepID=UPI0037927A73
MTAQGRSVRIRVLVAEQAALRGARVGVVDVCTAAVASLPVGGAGVSAMSRTAASHPLCSTDDISGRLEELQLTFGEGPCVDAFTHGTAVLTPDLRAGELQGRWPVFVDAALEAGALAVFALPLQMGAISPGVLDLYSRVPGRLNAEELADALVFADVATLVLLDTQIDETGASIGGMLPDGRLEDLGAYRAEIDQATGMLTVQLGVGIEEAFVRLRAHAYARGHRLAEVAADVVARRLSFSPNAPPNAPPDEGEGDA